VTAFTELTELEPTKNPPTATRRDAGPFLDAVGLVVDLRGRPPNWAIDEQLSYDEWFGRFGTQVSVGAAQKVLGKINTWKLAIVGSSGGGRALKRVSTRGGAIRRAKLLAPDHPYAKPKT
jgi:hypothetical protein